MWPWAECNLERCFLSACVQGGSRRVSCGTLAFGAEQLSCVWAMGVQDGRLPVQDPIPSAEHLVPPERGDCISLFQVSPWE